MPGPGEEMRVLSLTARVRQSSSCALLTVESWLHCICIMSAGPIRGVCSRCIALERGGGGVPVLKVNEGLLRATKG